MSDKAVNYLYDTNTSANTNDQFCYLETLSNQVVTAQDYDEKGIEEDFQELVNNPRPGVVADSAVVAPCSPFACQVEASL